jgi:putative transferase (TIGR04331 family)
MSDKLNLLIYDSNNFKQIQELNNYNIKYLGAWCLSNEEFNDAKFLEHDYWADLEKLSFDIEYVQGFTLKILESSYSGLKNEFSNSINLKDFINLYYSWTFYIVVKVLSNWRLFDNTSDTDVTYVLDINYFDVLANNLSDANMTYYYAEWNNYIISEVIKFRGVKHFEIKNIRTNDKTKNRNYLKNYIIKLIYGVSLLIESFKYKLSSSDWNLYYFSKSENLLPKYQKNTSVTKFVQLLYFKFKTKISKLKIDKGKRESMRLILEDSYKKDDFESFFSNLFFKLIPKSLFEGINNIERFSLGNFFSKNPKFLLYSDFLNNELLLYYLKEFNKDQIYVYQHGGGFGLNNFTVTEIIEKYFCERYITWGWKNSNIDEAFISPTFSDFIKIDLEIIRKGICLILYDSPPYVPVFQPTIYSKSFNKYILAIVSFLRFSKFTHQLSVRLYPRNDSGVNVSILFGSKISIDKSKTLDLLYSKYKLYVYTYNSTGFLELWSLGIPCILFIEHENWFVSDYCLNLYNNLKSVGLIITKSEDLETFLINNYNKIEVWWGSAEIQNNIVDFLNIYARNNRIGLKSSIHLTNIFNY